jgi:peptide/nickel transport system substrate-binding protein
VTLVSLTTASPGELVPFLSGTTPPKGTNFAYLHNAAYTADVTKALAIAGTAGCPDWNAAETAIFKNVDLVPFVNAPDTFYSKGATFQLSKDNLQPASIRMLG